MSKRSGRKSSLTPWKPKPKPNRTPSRVFNHAVLVPALVKFDLPTPVSVLRCLESPRLHCVPLKLSLLPLLSRNFPSHVSQLQFRCLSHSKACSRLFQLLALTGRGKAKPGNWLQAKRLPGFVIPETLAGPGHGGLTDGEVTDDDCEEEEEEGKDAADAPPKDKKKVKIAQELTDIVSLTGAKLHNLVEDRETHLVDSFVSVGETRMLGYLDNEQANLVAYTARHFVKSYPKGLRTNSSNMDPVPQWLNGVQIGTSLLPFLELF